MSTWDDTRNGLRQDLPSYRVKLLEDVRRQQMSPGAKLSGACWALLLRPLQHSCHISDVAEQFWEGFQETMLSADGNDRLQRAKLVTWIA